MAQLQSADGTTIGFEQMGAGAPIILVAGATQYRAVDRTSPRLMAALGGQFTIINYDRRGRGESGDTMPSAVAREIEDIAALIAEAGGRAGLFGMSSGAVLALEAAVALGDAVTGVFLYEPPLDVERTAAQYWQQHAEMADLAAQDRGPEMMERFMRGVGMPEDALQGFKASPAWPVYAGVGKSIEHDYRVLAEVKDESGQAPQRWQHIKAPVLVAAGDASYPFIAPAADWVAAGVPGAERIVVPGQGHDYDPTVLAPLIARFFADKR